MPYFRTNEQMEALSALEQAGEVAERIYSDPYDWKWAILALHSATQGLMVLALRGGNGLRALPDGLAAKWLEAYRARVTPPPEKLDSFPNLHRKIKGDEMMFFAHSKRFTPAGSEDHSMNKLNSLRNKFVHFLPGSWAIELAGLPSICLDCLWVGEFLSEASNNITWHPAPLHPRALRAFRKARAAFKTLDGSYS